MPHDFDAMHISKYSIVYFLIEQLVAVVVDRCDDHGGGGDGTVFEWLAAADFVMR